MDRVVFIGVDKRELDAFIVARHSLKRHSPFTTVHGLILQDMRAYGHYKRPTNVIGGKLHDDISDAPMSTEFALSRFLVPMMARNMGAKHALFVDCDMLFRADVQELFALADDRYAVMCVKHENKHEPGVKMDGCIQTRYARKNWSSVMLFNCRHPSNYALDVNLINSATGRDLHGFCWLKDHEIGELPARFNHLISVDKPSDDVSIAHFTLGVPSMPGYEQCEFADEWRKELLMAIR